MKNILCEVKKHRIVNFIILSILSSISIILITSIDNTFQIVFSGVLIYYICRYIYIKIFEEEE